jgi:16S rRNA A1518/A1519 N6-dimethyltransferase RsmA/KsgA/DIM1 with predicted DNA glycosylase/AP lyase activity
VSESSASLPIENVLKACEACFAERRKVLENELESLIQKLMDPSSGISRTYEQAEKGATHGARTREAYISGRARMTYPNVDQLESLCQAALRAGQSQITVSASDFSQIAHWYR